MKTKIKMIALLIFVGGCCPSCYDFNRQQAEKDAESEGKQILYEAEYSKQAKVEQAKADLEASKMESETKQVQAEADAKVAVINAKAKAEAINIISNALRNNDSYLRYLLITGMNNSDNKIYIPTEANIPILEAK